MIKSKNLSKSYRSLNVRKDFRSVKKAVDNLSFEIETGKVTGFLGPNGAGKSTTMRLMLGLDNGEGTVTYDDRALHHYRQPSKLVGILLEAKAYHPTRTARRHLKVLAAAGNIPDKRVDEVLEIVGLSEVAKHKPSKFSLGMSQRLGIAAAILGEPKYLILDEPANGLDPEGIAWLRQFLKDYAKQGRGVFVSSHLLSEMSQMADNVIVIGKGKLIADTSVEELVSERGVSVFVRVDKPSKLETALKTADLTYKKEAGGILVPKAKTDVVGKLAHSADVIVYELSSKTVSLEQAFLELTEGTQEFQSRSTKGGK